MTKKRPDLETKLFCLSLFVFCVNVETSQRFLPLGLPSDADQTYRGGLNLSQRLGLCYFFTHLNCREHLSLKVQYVEIDLHVSVW